MTFVRLLSHRGMQMLLDMDERYMNSNWMHISAEGCVDRTEVQAWIDKVERGDHPKWIGRWADDRDWFEADRRQRWDGTYIR